MSERNDENSLGPPDQMETQGNTTQSTNKATGAEYITAGAGALDSIMGVVSFFATGQGPAQEPPPPPPPPPPPSDRKGWVIGAGVVVVLIILMLLFYALRKNAMPAV